MKITLTEQHCKEVLNTELRIGVDTRANKKFTFHVWLNEYRVYKGDEIIDSGQAIEELLNIYNDL